MAIKCINCGGNMKYHIKDELLKCEHCDSAMMIGENPIVADTNQINEKDFGFEKEIETLLYQCGECGASIRAFEEETTIFCPYCGKQTFLKQKETSIRPKYIIPFKKDKNDIKTYYNKFIEKKKFVPDELKNPNFIKEFRGIYIPHWSFSYDLENELLFKGEKRYTSGKYDYYEEYDIYINGYRPIKEITFDASKAFVDSIATEISPFKTIEAKPFDEGYIAGFYADKETVESELYEEKAQEIATKKIEESIETGNGKKKMYIKERTNEPIYKKNKTDLLLLPVWFLTYRNKDRVSYFIVNGQTGKTTMDLPVDKKSFFKTAGILSIILSILFTFLFSTILYTTTATNISYFSLIALLISSFILYKETNMIYIRDNHLDFIGGKKEKNPSKKKTTIKIIPLIIILTLFCNIIPIILNESSGNTKPTFFTVLITIPIVIAQIILNKKAKKVPVKNEKIFFILSTIIMIVSIALYVISFPNDWFYYGISIASAIGIVLNSICCISGFDYLTSRPIPNFFERKGAKHNE